MFMNKGQTFGDNGHVKFPQDHFKVYETLT